MKRRADGFTLLEVSIAGAILLIGMLMVANVTRTVLDTSAADSASGVQNSAIIDAYLRSEIALLKACRDSATPLVPAVPYGNGTLQPVVGAPAHVATTPASPNGNYNLMEYDVQITLTQPGQPTVTVARTRFWKLWRGDYAKAGV